MILRVPLKRHTASMVNLFPEVSRKPGCRLFKDRNVPKESTRENKTFWKIDLYSFSGEELCKHLRS
jgi:hypothetical protein